MLECQTSRTNSKYQVAKLGFFFLAAIKTLVLKMEHILTDTENILPFSHTVQLYVNTKESNNSWVVCHLFSFNLLLSVSIAYLFTLSLVSCSI